MYVSNGWNNEREMSEPANQRFVMTMHYPGTPISPISALYELTGRCFCVPHSDPRDVRRCHAIGQSIMLDNGAFSLWRRGLLTNWSAYYEWAEEWLAYPTTWAVIPDHIDAGPQVQDDLLEQWPTAFILAASADWLMYVLLRDRPWLVRSNGSNIVGAAVDSIVFPTMAFGAFLPAVIFLQFVAKVGGGAVWSLLMRSLILKERAQDEQVSKRCN